MVKSLKDYVMMYKPTYEFVVKCAFDVNECKECLDKFEKLTDAKHELIKKSEVKRNAFAPSKDFPNIEGLVETWEFTVEYAYPVQERQLEEEFKQCFLLDTDNFKIRKSNSAQVKDSEEKELKNEKEALLNTAEPEPLQPDVKAEDLYGDKYNEEMVKTLTSKEAEKELPHEEEVKLKD